MAIKVLLVATSHPELGDTGKPSGSWVEEVASPYYTWLEKGYEVDILSIKGGEVPFDPASKQGDFCTPEAKRFLDDKAAQELVSSTKSINEVLDTAAGHYDALFLPGGHGIVFDGPPSQALKQLVESFWNAGKVVSAVCHGPAGLVSACNPDGTSILNGRRVTGFTNAEEVAVGLEKAVPFLLEDRMKELGGLFESSQQGLWVAHAVRDGNLVTGQNPGSSQLVAEEVIAAIAARE